MEGAMRSMPNVVVFVLSLVLPALTTGEAFPQTPPKSTTEAPASAADPLGRDTPRGTVLGFIKAVDSGNYERAVQYLDTRAAFGAARELARQLKDVLDRRLSATDFDLLSAKPEGRLDSDLPPNGERVLRGGDSTDIFLERVSRDDRLVWLFAARTLANVPTLHRELGLPFIERVMPESWRKVRILDISAGQWIVLLLGIPFVLGLAWLLSRLLATLLRVALFRVTRERADEESKAAAAPLRLLAGALAIAVLASFEAFPVLTRVFWHRIAMAAGIVGFAWLLLRLVDIVAHLTETHLRAGAQTGHLAVNQLFRRVTKVMVVLAAGLALFFLAGFNLTAALAGLGIGGIAVALAAQKTLENFFGGIMIIWDQPVRVGDFCKIGDVSGVVEDIGLRSTRLRTQERTVVSIPNGQTAAVNVENFGVRDRILFRPTIGLRYETGPEQLRYVLAEIRQLLYEHPMVETQSARARFVRFGASSLELEIFAYVLTYDFTRFLEIQEDLLLRIMDVIETGGTGMAFSSSTTYLARDVGLDRQKAQAATATVKRWRDAGDLPFPNFRPERIAELHGRLEYPSSDSAVKADRSP
jgi:MscS family membrane protein